MKRCLNRYINIILRIIQVQFFLTLVSLPITTWWGIPISLMGIVGNSLFAPFFVLFLLSSALLYCLICLYIPSSWLAYIINTITAWWYACLSLNQSWWLVGLHKNLFLVTLFSAIISIIFIHHRQFGRLIPSIMLFSSLLSTIAFCHYFYKPPNSDWNIFAGTMHARILHHQGYTSLFDRGTLSRRASTSSWALYTLLPEIIKKTGRLRIDFCFIHKPTKRALHALKIIASYAYIKHIFLLRCSVWIKKEICAWKKELPKHTFVHIIKAKTS